MIDPRGPRFGAAITSVLLLVVVLLGLTAPLGTDLVARALQPAALLLTEAPSSAHFGVVFIPIDDSESGLSYFSCGTIGSYQ